MKKIHNLTFTLIALSLWLVLSSWGSAGHRKINQHAPASFPSGLNFLRSSWTTILADHASDADDRKQWDNSESAKHYIDIDNYNEFVLYGKIPMTLDSVTSIYGISFVLNQGILPWATLTTFDSLKACFQRNDFNKASLFASDLGHYVADGHMPLHITQYYEGKTSSQSGIHSRYETHMIDRYNDNILYPDDTAQFITDVTGYIFTYLYHNNKYVDSVLLADDYAQSVSGSHSSSAYYQALWDRTGTFTTGLFKHASWSLANLIYTAWVEAGSPNSIPSHFTDPTILGQNHPNPFSDKTSVPIDIKGNDEIVTLKVFNSSGNQVATLLNGKMKKGRHQVIFNTAGLPSGIYFYTLQSGDAVMTRKMVIIR